MELKNIRKEIDEIDSRLMNLLNERAKKVLKIAKIKEKEGKNPYSPGREKRILKKAIEENKGPLPAETLKEVFQLILKTSLSLEKELRIVYLGPEATFTHLAALKTFGERTELIPLKSINTIFTEVEKKKADYGVVPVENSTEGVITHTLDMFVDSDLKICAEVILEITHYLMGRGSIKGVKKVYSHPQAFAQCQGWLEENLPEAKLIETESTAQAACAAAKETGSAAIASEIAASLYKLKILASRIEDNPNNYTRFFVIGREYTEKSGEDKTSIIFSIKDRVGALYNMLSPFEKYKINLTKIESRPTKKKPWEYIFFVDFIGHKDEERVKKALLELEKECLFLKILGSYPLEK